MYMFKWYPMISPERPHIDSACCSGIIKSPGCEPLSLLTLAGGRDTRCSRSRRCVTVWDGEPRGNTAATRGVCRVCVCGDTLLPLTVREGFLHVSSRWSAHPSSARSSHTQRCC